MNLRGFLRGAGAVLVAGPAIVRASSLMAIAPWRKWVSTIPMGQAGWTDGERFFSYDFNKPQIYTVLIPFIGGPHA